MTHTKNHLYKKWWPLIILMLQQLRGDVKSSCRITNIISGYYLKSGINQPNIKKLGESDNLALCKKLSCKEDIYDFGLFDGKQCYGILCLHNTDKRCMLKRDGNADYTIFKIHAQSSPKRKKHDRYHSTKKNGYQISNNSLQIPLKNKFVGNRTFIIQSHRTTNVHKENKQLHRKHKKRREKRKAQIDAGKHAVFQNMFLYNNQTELLTKKQLTKKPYFSTLTSLNPNFKLVSYSKPFNVYGFSTNQQNPPKKLLVVNPSSNEVSYSMPSFVSKEVPSQNPALINSYIHPETLSNGEKMLYSFTYPPLTNNYNKDLSTANFVIQESLSNSSNLLGESNVNKRMNIDSTAFSSFNEDQHQPFLNNLTKSNNLSEKKDNLIIPPVQNEIVQKAVQSSNYGSQNFNNRKGIISDVQPLRDFPTDTDLAVEEKDIIPSPDELRKLDDQTMAAKDSVIDIPFSSKNQLQDLPVLQKGCVNPIGISQPALIKDFQFSASSSMENFPPSKARLLLKENGEEYSGSWCSSANSKMENMQPFLQVDLRKRTMFCRLAIQGDDNVRKWVKKFKVHYSDDGVKWDPYSEEGVAKIFMGNEDEKDITFRTLKNPVIARYVRFKPIQWEGDSPCMRVEMFNAGVQGLDNSVLRSTIPSVHFGLVVDLDFEKMDELIALDKSSFGNNGFLHGGAKIFDTHSSCRHAVQIPIGSDIVIDGSVMKVHPRKAISIALWIQLNRVDGVHSIFDTVGRNSKHNLGQFHFEIVGGDVRWFHRNETESEIFNLITEQKLIKSHEWNHIAATYDSKTGATIIYINGTEQVRGKGQGLISKDWSEHVGIGQHKGVRFLDGQIDEFKIYDSAITAEHVDELASKCDFSRYYCGQTLTEETGSIFSPSYPDTQNGPVECVWNIQGDIGETVSLDMSQFKLGYKSDCGKGNLEVRDKNSVIGVYCGASITPRRILSHSNQLTIKYSTDGAFTGEKFRIDFKVNRKKTKKNSVNHQCVASKTIGNVTLVGGVKAGNFTDLGSVSNMEDCKNRCCNLEECQVAFLIDDSCYAVKCARPQLCQPRRAKSTALYPQLLYIKNRIKLPFLSDPTDPNINPSESDIQPHKLCPHDEKLVNVTLVGGIKSGNFTSHGTVQNFEECLQYCCLMNNCDLAFMVKQTCFSLKCANSEVCTVRPARPSVYNPTVAFIKRNKALSTFKVPTVSKVPAVIPKVLPIESNKAACKDIRLSKVHHGVTLSGGINAGEFTDKGHVETMDECVERCCSSDSCNVAFVIKDTCFAVKCKSYNDCNLKSAMSEYYNPRIVFVNWSPPKDLGESVPYLYEGCWHDFDISAFALPLLEGTSPILNTLYKKRQDPVNDCSSVSQSRGYKVFAIQNGGACFSGPNAEQTYKRYGKSDACKEGKGGPFANSVYKLFDDGSVIALGCWADLQDRSFRRMESNDPLLFDSFESRADPIGTCARVATKMKIKYFAMQKGGQCFVAKDKQKVNYNRYSPSRKCKYGLGGPMANDVYMLKLNFTDNPDVINKTKVQLPQDDIFPGETVYKEEIVGNHYIRYLYKATPPMNNVTLASAINAGTFEDKGKMDTISECIKACGVSPDCNVAFMLSSQCFNVHCFSDETCRTKPAYSTIYKPELSYIKHRVIRKPRNKTEIAVKDKTCKAISEHNNVTFIAGINAGNFSDMGHTTTMDDCKARCCHDKDCNIAFKIEDDCYGVRCYSKSSCQMRPAKNAYLFNPQMAVIRKINDSLEQAVEENITAPLVSLKIELTTTVSPQTTSSLSTTMKKCSGDLWDEEVVRNSTLVGGINAGTFRDHGQVDSIGECMEYCCSESDCDLSFMIDQDCYTVKCYSESVCLTRKAKPTAFTTLIAYKKAYKIAIRKANLTTLLKVYKYPSPEKELSPDIAYASLKSELLHPTILDMNRLTNVTEISLVEYINSLLNGTTPSSTFMFSSATNVATPSFGSPKEHSCKADPIIFNATLRMGMHSGLFTKLGRVKQMDDCIERCCHSSNADVAYMLGPFCFAVKCKTKEMCKPSPAMYSDIKSLNLNPAISFLNKPGLLGLSGQSQTNNNEKGVCADSPINYNVTLRGGVHSGKFIELGEGINMRECVSKCCDTPLCDVAFMFSDKCYAVGCFDEASCQAVIAKPSNLNPKLAYVTKYRPNTVLSLDSATSGILFDINNENPKTCDPETIEHGPIHVNKTLSGGMKYGYYSYLGKAYDIKSCLSKCCESGKCDMAYLVNKEQCFSVKCLTPELCEIRDHPFKNKWIEISALVKSSETKKKKYQAVSVLPLLLVSLVVMTAGLTGLIWAILIFVRRHKTKKQNEKSNDDEDDGIPRPER
ncbi:uncharacterized protein LOC100203833 isoform X35 [Hydra vulgaris]|uniref:Uncharacterized protein LOC100203833 isoform X35 n=2 Tax=Hydra vulgaris TaxID=6087 RepID=A0ABM4B764_HYDVU